MAVDQKLREILSVIVQCEPKEIPVDAARDQFPRWDSLGHMSFMLAIEEEFGITFSDQEILELNSLPKIQSAVEHRN